MRPGLILEPPQSRSRKPSNGDSAPAPHGRPTTFFLTRDIDSVAASNSVLTAKNADVLPTSKEFKSRNEIVGEDLTRMQIEERHEDAGIESRRRSTIKASKIEGLGPGVSSHYSTSTRTHSSSALESSNDSPKSNPSSILRRSDDESLSVEIASHAVASSDEGQDGMSVDMDQSAPQLVMPSIRMPSRRPFTEKGKRLGRLKILVAGSKGCGRTSIIKSIVQLCEDIVHVDPLTTPFGYKEPPSPKDRSAYSEIYASTKPYPEWWTDIDESRILKRRKQVGNSVLERNVCFVDMKSNSVDDSLAYIEQQFFKTVNSVHQPGSELGNLLNGSGGSQVDVVLYLITKDTVKGDIESIERMALLTNVVPLISKADLLSEEILASLKTSTSMCDSALQSLPPFAKNEEEVSAKAPYRVSSANGPDFDTMDASLLMSPEYVQPLLPSELSLVVKEIFDPTIASYLRHVAAKKIVTWYISEPKLTKPTSPGLAPPSSLGSPVHTSLTYSGMLVPVKSEVSLNTSNSYALAKVVDHTQREEHLAQIRLCKWASELQLSLQRERERYESIARSERAIWLMQRMGEEIRDGQLVPLTAIPTPLSTDEQLGRFKQPVLYSSIMRHEIHDPLGLLRWQDVMRARGWVLLQVVGSFGVIGGVAVWIAKYWGFTASLNGWAREYGLNLFESQ